MRRVLLKPSLVVMALLLLALQYQLWFQPSGILTLITLKQEALKGETENAKLRERNKTLKQNVSSLKSDREAIENRAREELGLVKKGETYYRVVERKTA